MSIPAASGDFAAFFPMLFDSIRPVSGTNGDVDPGDQLNQYVRPTASQLASWRAVFQSLLAGDWDSAHLQAQMISLTYNVVQFLDARTGRTYYVLMEGLPGDIPVAVDHLSGSVKITDPHDPTRRGWGTYVFDPQPQRALSLSAPHLFDCFRTEVQAAEAFLGLRARTLLSRGDRPGPEHVGLALRSGDSETPLPGGRRVTYGGVGLPDGLRGDLLKRRDHVAPPVPRERHLPGGRVPEQRRRSHAGHARHALCAQREHRGCLDGRGGRRG